ncbi:MAG TPA: F0F1 ATP synthase subunit A [Polyangiaceae bacterium]|nr:F0F1 ATP synthase subunit A [Polyangiaceae bacterium]
MPEHSTWLTFFLGYMKDTLEHNAQHLGASFVAHTPPSWQSWEPLFASLFVMLLAVLFGLGVRRSIHGEQAVIPEESLTLRTFAEAFLEYFYELAKSVMDAERAKKYFPIIGTAAIFIFFSNAMALIPGAPVATSNLSVTAGCGLVVFVLFNLYGLKEQGFGYIKHLMGPAWYLAWLIFPVEIISLCVRPITLAIRLMLNMAVDHLILSIFLGLVAVLVPLPIMILGCLVVLVQTLVFTLLTCIYIGLATEHEAH